MLRACGPRPCILRSASLRSDNYCSTRQLNFRDRMNNKQHFSLWYFAGVMLVLFAVQTYLGDPHVQVLAYSDFQTLLQAGKIKEVTIAEDQLTGIASPPRPGDAAQAKDAKPTAASQTPTVAGADDYRFVAARVPDANLVAELQAAKVKFAGRIENRGFWTVVSWIAPAAIFVVFWALVMRRMGGARWAT